MSDGSDNWPEFERLAAERKRDESRPQPAQNDDAIHIGDVPETDTSDQRKYSFGISNVDRDLGPMRPGGFTLLCALTGRGKTILAEQAAYTNAAAGYEVMLATLEQTEIEVRDSMIARKMGWTLEDAEREMRDDTEEYRAARKALNDLPLHLWRPKPSRPRRPDDILKAAQRLKADMLIIDYTRHIDGWNPGNEANTIAKYFAEAVKESHLQLLLLGQLKFGKERQRPTLDDIADSTQLPQAADKVIFLHRPFAGDKKRDIVTEIISPKNRKGKLFKAHVHWYGPTRSFYAMDDAEEARCECCKPKKKSVMTPTLADVPQVDLAEADFDENLPF